MRLKYRYIDIYFKVLRTKDQNFIFIKIFRFTLNILIKFDDSTENSRCQ